MEFYDLSVDLISGKVLKMADFKGKPVLLTNTPTHYEDTTQFDELEALFRKYREDDLIVLGFPCGQFHDPEPADKEDVKATNRIEHGVTFILTQKIEVKGLNEHPIFKFLSHALPGPTGPEIQGDFTKFLITREGRPYKRYEPETHLSIFEDDLKTVLQ